MAEQHTFQAIIIKLQEFWARHGCLIWQPYYTQVGAGTMNPATFLRVLGPEPWNVAYVEPSVRPDDGRYGENPNRFQVHYQYQVILKPDPGNPQELYLDSLKALGIDPRWHDIRFVEDNWEQPAISAWGLGWEVWLDGQEITQFTYFQQVGGVTLDPVAVELTYGLERILIALNNAGEIWSEPWGGEVPYGEIRRQEEFEHSKYYFEVAGVERVRQMFDLYKAEAEACLEQGLVLPAHDYVLKCSHVFNTLDTRGAVGVTERQAFFHQMRGLARQVAESYLEQRRRLEYPLLKEVAGAGRQTTGDGRQTTDDGRRMEAAGAPLPFLLEIGVEELPPGDVTAALEQLERQAPVWLEELRLEHGAIRVDATPRRLVVQAADLSPRQPDREELVKGPPAERAFDADGKPTKAAEGFARGKGLDVKDLQVVEVDGGKYVGAVIKEAGRPAGEVLLEALPGFAAGISFVKTMRWLSPSRRAENDPGAAFSRPIRWLAALLGEQVIPFEYAGLTAGRTTRGLRPYDSPEIEIRSADQYEQLICKAEIVLDSQGRSDLIAEQVQAAAAKAGGEAIVEPGLLAEVTHLVEKPTPVLGSFNPDFLALPRDVLISVMKKHQRYFPVEKNGKLLPNFIAIRNGDEQHLDIVREGNEHVLNARFADANFFVREDLKQKLEAYRPALSGLIFQTDLGSMLDKSERMLRLADQLAPELGISGETLANLQRAVYLAKADLVTQMCVEMTSLQGIIGREYALRSGENEVVAAAIAEQYQPAPSSGAGLGLALVDRIDSLVGLFAAGLAPTGAKDPFALRRAAIGTVQPLIEHDIDFDLKSAVEKAAALQPVEVGDEVKQQVLEFLTGRLRVVLQDKNLRYDVVDAVLAAQPENPAAAARAARQLQAWVERDDWDKILPGYARCVRIIRAAELAKDLQVVDDGKLVEEAEKALYIAIQATVVGSPSSVDEFLTTIEKLIPVIDRFFDEVLVMAEDPVLKQNRLALVGQIAGLSAGLADLGSLEGF
ncbi:MAG: glycine--tRNA ligase subunit beta [Anaerolineales bacterium]|nr:glycine--tRNA ligase subunit beta [Anaerolineales bacterium]